MRGSGEYYDCCCSVVHSFLYFCRHCASAVAYAHSNLYLTVQTCEIGNGQLWWQGVAAAGACPCSLARKEFVIV